MRWTCSSSRDDEAWRLRRQWEFGRRFLYRWNDADRLLFWGRLPIVAPRRAARARPSSCGRARAGACPPARWPSSSARSAPTSWPTARSSPPTWASRSSCSSPWSRSSASSERATPGRLLAAGLAAGAAVATKFSMLVLGPILVGAGRRGRAVPRADARAWTREAARTSRAAARAPPTSRSCWRGSRSSRWSCSGRRTASRPPSRRIPAVEAAFDWGRVSGRGGLVDAAMGAARRVHLLPEAYVYGFLRFFRHSEARPDVPARDGSPTAASGTTSRSPSRSRRRWRSSALLVLSVATRRPAPRVAADRALPVAARRRLFRPGLHARPQHRPPPPAAHLPVPLRDRGPLRGARGRPRPRDPLRPPRSLILAAWYGVSGGPRPSALPRLLQRARRAAPPAATGTWSTRTWTGARTSRA